MTMQVLRRTSQIDEARRELTASGVPAPRPPSPSRIAALARRFGSRQPKVGDYVKSWDVLATLRFLEASLSRDDPIIDLGAYASEVLVALHVAGFTDLTGVDLNPDLSRMPYADHVRYVVRDFMDTGLDAGNYAAVTAISVIEHGYDPTRLFAEVSRLLRPGGYFVASFDYWPDKIPTRGTTFFGMSWLIFGREDVTELLAHGARHGLEPVGEMLLDADERAIHHGGFDYTFGWLALRKRG